MDSESPAERSVEDLVAWLEERLGIEIDPVDVVLENFQTVDRMLAYLDRAHGVSGGDA